MDPVLRAVLLSWNWRLDVILVLALAGTLYTTGWWRLRERTRHSRNRYQQRARRSGRGRWPLAVGWRLVAYLLGLVFIGLALLSPVDALGGQLFFMHMIQHLLLIMIAPPLMLIANPLPFVLWGLPATLRRRLGYALSVALHRDSFFRRALRSTTASGAIWLFWVISLVGWHDPTAYNAALRNEFIHDLEHLSFFLASMLFWWHVTGAGPRIHRQHGLIGRIALVIAAVPPNMLVGIVLAFAEEVIYTYYLDVPRLWGIDVLTDQQIGGVIMWVPGSMMYLIAALILISRLLQGEENKPVLPESEWATEQTLAASGVEK